MYEVPSVYVDADYEVDASTGEIVRGPETQDGDNANGGDAAADGQQRMTV